jgi:putative ABC transport system permease protein
MTQRRDDDVEREIRAHLELEAEEREAEGLSRTDAEYAARRAFGSVALVQEDVRAVWTTAWIDETRQDLRYALRTLRSNPGFAAVAILTLALGIGATTATFSVVRGVLLQPLPFMDAERIVQIVENVPAAESFSGRPLRLPSMNVAEFDWWRTEARTLSHLAVAMPETRTLVTSEGATRLQGARVSPALFEMRGVPPLVGRWLRADEERPATASVVVLAASTWRRHFGGDANVVGRGVALDGDVFTVVGVMPDAFGREAFWTPFVVGASRSGALMFVPATARLRDGVTLDSAAAEINALGARLRQTTPAPGQPARFEVIGEQDQMVAGVRPALRVLVVSVAVVLLIVCANVGNLLLARGIRRHQEIGVRRALGATRFRMVRQLLTESVVLSVAGGVCGAAFAYLAVSLVRGAGVIEIPAKFRFALGWLGETILPRVDEITVDPGVLIFAFGLSLMTGVLFGLVPAAQLSRVDHATVTAAAATQRATSSGTYVGHLLASLQLALATALLVTAGLLVYSFVKLSSLPLGFDTDTQIFQLVSPGDYRPSRKIALATAVEERLRAMAGVEVVGFTNMEQPLEAENSQGTIVPPGWPVDRADPGDENRSESRQVTAGYLRALGVRLVEGRWIDDGRPAGAARPVLVNRAWARRFSPDSSPVGTTAVGLCRTLVRSAAGNGCVDRPVEIVGVVDDMRLRLEGGSGAPIGGLPRPDLPKAVFVSLRHALPPPDAMDRQRGVEMGGADSAGGPDGLSFALRPRSAALTAADLRRVAREVDPLLSVEDLTTMGDVVSAITARPRFYAGVLSAFGGFAAFIAAMGVYGVLAYSMSQRTREFGIRLALGAVPRHVLRLALRQGVLVIAVGITAGVIGATAVTRYLSGLLFGLTPLDVPTYAAVAIGFAVVAMFASYLPARRATRVNPVVALRCE